MEIIYPADIKAEKRKAFKHSLLQNNPECLYADLTSQEKKTNLILYTNRSQIWKNIFINYFPYTKKKGICKGCQICIYESADHSSHYQTINLYNSGMILIQGNEASLRTFEESFPHIKQRVENEPQSNVEEESEEENEPMPCSSVCISSVPSDEVMDTNTSTYLQCLPEKITLLEMEVSELKQLILCRPDEFTLKNLMAEIKDLQNSNIKLRAEITKMKEDTTQRERNFERNIEELNEKLKQQHKDKESKSPNNSTEDDELHEEMTSHSTTTPDTENSHVNETTDTQPPTRRPPETAQASVVLMMDSNGKNLNPRKLFPRQRVLALRCRNTDRAHELLSTDELCNPQYIIIHTGTNDLHSLKEGTAQAMYEMADKASQTFPTTRVLISTLLPRHDFPPSVIDKINEEINRTCSSLPNVHLVHHNSIRLWHLYDGLHLNQDGIKIFAKAIKDVAYGRSPTPGYRGSGPSQSKPSQVLHRQHMPSRWTQRQQGRQPYAEARPHHPPPVQTLSYVHRPQPGPTQQTLSHAQCPPPESTLQNLSYVHHPQTGPTQQKSSYIHRPQPETQQTQSYNRRPPPGPNQQKLSYAQVLSQQQPSSSSAHELNSADVGEIKHLLNLLCNKMFN